MADENTTVEAVTEDTATVENAVASQSSAETETQNTTSEHMIPKSRFDEINTELKKLRKAQADAEKAQEEAANAALAEQNNYKALHEKTASQLETLKAELEAERLTNIRNTVGAKHNVPAELIPRLQGSNLEEIEADAEQLMRAIPKPSAPNVGNSTGEGDAPKAGAMTDVEKAELAAIYGVAPQFIQ